ncbi:hypothetical protein ACFL4W_02265 [Planctomycetota bacterium]
MKDTRVLRTGEEGLSGIAYVFPIMAAFFIGIICLIKVPQMWGLSGWLTPVWLLGGLVCFFGLVMIGILASRGRPGVPGLTSILVGLGIVGYLIFLLKNGTEGFSIGGLFLHVQGPALAGMVILGIRGLVFAWLEKSGKAELADKLEWM